MSKINISKPFREQYSLTIDSEINTIDAFITSTIRQRYDFQVIQVNDETLEVYLITLENQLVKANNPMVQEVASLSQIFGKIFRELHLILSLKGEVLQVLNPELILRKWEEVKEEMKSHLSDNPNLEQAIIMNDSIFNNPDKIRTAIQANEFFSTYFGQIFNEDIPISKKIFGTNIFNTANISWICDSKEMIENSSENNIFIITESQPIRPFSEGYINAAYQHFKDKVSINPDDIKMYQREDRDIEKETGKLNKVTIKKIEEVVPQKLYQKFYYAIISDSYVIKQEEKKKNIPVGENIKEEIDPQKTKVYKVVDGKELTYEEWKIYEQQQWEAYQRKKNKKGFFRL